MLLWLSWDFVLLGFVSSCKQILRCPLHCMTKLVLLCWDWVCVCGCVCVCVGTWVCMHTCMQNVRKDIAAYGGRRDGVKNNYLQEASRKSGRLCQWPKRGLQRGACCKWTLCIIVSLNWRIPCWRHKTIEGSKASGLFCNEKQECKVYALNNKQTGHCMPSSQDVLPSTKGWLGLEEKPARAQNDRAQSEPH